MLDLFLEAAYTKTKQAEAQQSMLSALERLPVDELMAITRGESPLNKVAFHGDDPMCWLENFQGTPLYEEALAIEKRQLELDMQENADRQKNQGIYNERDVLRVKRRMLELQLAEQHVGGADEIAAEAPDGAAPPVAETAAPAPTGEGAANVKKAFVGVGVDVGSFGESKKMKGTINIGFPHIVSVNARHKPSGLGAGLGLTGPVVSWSPTTMAKYEKSKTKEADAAHISNLIHEALQQGAGGVAKLKPSMYGHIKDAPKAGTKLREITMKSLGGGHPALSGGFGAKLSSVEVEKIASMRFQAALHKLAFNPLAAIKTVGQQGMAMAAKNPTAAMGIGGAALGAGMGAAAGGPGHRLSGALGGAAVGGAAGAAGGFAMPRMQSAMAKGQSFGQAAKSTLGQAANALGPTTQVTSADIVRPPVPARSMFRPPAQIVGDLPARRAPTLPTAPARPTGFTGQLAPVV